jgi:hypothetical protein
MTSSEKFLTLQQSVHASLRRRGEQQHLHAVGLRHVVDVDDVGTRMFTSHGP